MLTEVTVFAQCSTSPPIIGYNGFTNGTIIIEPIGADKFIDINRIVHCFVVVIAGTWFLPGKKLS